MSESKVFQWRRAVAATSLPLPTKAVAFALSLHMNGRGTSCYPSVETLARETSAHRATVMRALTMLEREGLVTVTRTAGRSNRYAATIPVAHSDPSQTATPTRRPQRRDPSPTATRGRQ